MTNTKIGDILHMLMGDMSESALARAVNLPKATVNRVLSGSTPDPRAGTLLPIAQYFNITIEQLMGAAELPINSPLRSTNSLMVKIPFISFENLTSWIKDEYKPEKFYEITSFSNKILDSNCFITQIKSDEMAPLLSKNSFLIVKKHIKIQDDDVIILVFYDEIIIRKYIILKGEKYLVSSNPTSDIINFEETMKLIGVVIEGRILI
jgi:SOS-response transcriptional repressor LexA